MRCWALPRAWPLHTCCAPGVFRAKVVSKKNYRAGSMNGSPAGPHLVPLLLLVFAAVAAPDAAAQTPNPTISIDSPSVTEGDSGSANLTFTVILSAASGQRVTVDWAEGTGGTATSGTDYTAITGGTLTFAAGTTSQDITVSVIGDTLDEADETVAVTLSNAANATIGTATGTGTITDNDDAPTVTLSVADDSISENGGSTTVSAALSHASSEATTITISPLANAYAVGSDATIAIAAGETANPSDTATISAVDNDVGEADRSVTVTGSASNARGIGQVTGASLTLEDDDGGAGPTEPRDGEPTVSIDSPSVAEGNSGSATLTFTATLSAASGQQVTVQYADAGTGTATSGTDYTAITGGTLTFAAGTTSQTFDVSVTGDTLDESNETVVVTLSGPTNATISTASGTGTITDDDGTPTLSINSPSVTEGNSGSTTLTFTATLSAASGRQVTVAYADAGTGTATSGTDYTAITGGTLTFAAGTTSQTFDVSVTGDTLDESNETVVVTLSSPTNATISTATGTGTITDDDGTPTLSINSPSVAEGDSGSATLTFTATLSAASGQQVTVAYADAGTGTATSGTDYTAITGGTLTFTAGTTSQTLAVSVTGDVLDESNETVVVTLSSPTNATIATASGTGTITDDDAAPTSITLTVDDDTVREGDGATTIAVTATVDGTTRFADSRTVRVSVAGSGAAGAVDFAAVPAFDIEIAAGAASHSGTFTLTPTDNAAIETDETITVSGASGGLTVNAATITLTDDDGVPTSIALTVDDNAVGEGDGAATIAVTATPDGAIGFAEDRTVRVSVSGSGASGVVDFAAVPAFDIEIAAGAASGAGTFTLRPADDAVDEADETVTVSGASGDLPVSPATIALIDDDAPPTVSIDSPSVSEGDSGSTDLTFTVTLSAASGKRVTVSWVAGTGGTATSGTDYRVLDTGTLTFEPGETEKTIVVSVAGDTVDEGDETVQLTLSNSANAVIETRTGTGTIMDDDGEAPTLSIDSPSVAEGDDGSASLTYTVTLSAAGGRTVTVDYADAGTGTATPGTDYAVLDAGTLTFEPGDTGKTIAVSVTGDTLDEPDETVVLALSGPSNATLETASGVGTIVDDDIDLTPSFGSATIPDRSWTQNRAITAFTLPSATGGDGTLTHELSPALPGGVAHDPATREVSGTPTVSAERTIHTWRAKDADGDTAELTFAVTVVPDRMPEFADGGGAAALPRGRADRRPSAAGGDRGRRGAEIRACAGTARGAALRRGDAAVVGHADRGDGGDRIPADGHGRGRRRGVAEFRDRGGRPDHGVDRGRPGHGGRARRVRDHAVRAGAGGGDGGLADNRRHGAVALRLRGAAGRTRGVDDRGGAERGGDRRSDRGRRPGGGRGDLHGDAGRREQRGVGRRRGHGRDRRRRSGVDPRRGAAMVPGGIRSDGGDGGGGRRRAALPVRRAGRPARAAGLGHAGGLERAAGRRSRHDRGGLDARRLVGSRRGRPRRIGTVRRRRRGGWAMDIVGPGFDRPVRRPVRGGAGVGRGGSHRPSGRGRAAARPRPAAGRGAVAQRRRTGLPGAGKRPGRGAGGSGSEQRAAVRALDAARGRGAVGAAGRRLGEVDLTDGFGGATTDTAMRMAALGGRGELASWRGLGLALKGDALVVGMEGSAWARGDLAGLPKVDGNASRLRVMMEGRREWRASERSQLGLSLEFGGRWDGGDADKGMGAELGGGLEYRHTAWGLSVSARGRYLLEHSARAFEEWGASLALEFDPGEEGVGASLNLSPTWGEASRGVENLWRNERLPGAGPGAPDGRERWGPGRMEMELGYGFKAGGSRLLRLYGALSGDGPGSGNWCLGGQMTGGRISWSLELDRRENPGGPPRHGILLKFGTGPANGNLYGPPLHGSASPVPLR